MKKITFVLMITLLVTCIFGGCKLRLPEERPEDFAIYFEWGVGEGNFIDTYEGKVGKDLVAKDPVSAEYTVSEEFLDEAYFALRQYGVAAMRTEMTSQNLASPLQGTVDVDPCGRYLIRFTAYGKEYTVRGDDTASGYSRARNFFAFNRFMAGEVKKIWEELNFPEAEGGYM